jgi:hypothetical protein
MLTLDINAVIITRDIVRLRKSYWKYKGMIKLKNYQIEEDNNSNLSIVELIDNNHGEDKDDAGEDKDNANEKIIKTELIKVNNKYLQKNKHFQYGTGIYKPFTIHQEGKMMTMIWNMVKLHFYYVRRIHK